MQPVEFLDDGATSQFPNGNLKPLSSYTTNLKTADLEELAAVTPVMNAATRFLAADLLGDVAAGYRNDYDQFHQLEKAMRVELVGGRRHLFEAEMKEDRRSHGDPAHTSTPPVEQPIR